VRYLCNGGNGCNVWQEEQVERRETFMPSLADAVTAVMCGRRSR